jgi:hypothetical protein
MRISSNDHPNHNVRLLLTQVISLLLEALIEGFSLHIVKMGSWRSLLPALKRTQHLVTRLPVPKCDDGRHFLLNVLDTDIRPAV